MNIVIFGASGMVGSGVLIECLEDPVVDSVLVVGRSSCGIEHQKLHEIIHDDFFDYSNIQNDLTGLDACLFCLGVSAAGMSEETYTRLTLDLTLAAAHALIELNPELTFCYVSGMGTDSSESGRMMWARIKGKTENTLLNMPFRNAYMFRPGFIQPVKGVRTKTRVYRVFYAILMPLIPLLRALFPNQITTTEMVGQAMLQVLEQEDELKIIESPDIVRLARSRSRQD